MYWKIIEITAEARRDTPLRPDGRFVLHRHHDQHGPHLDLRLEQGDHLLGWRIEGEQLGEGCWAREKASHPLHWLEQDGPAIREDEGHYAWETRDEQVWSLTLYGRTECRQMRIERQQALPGACVGELLHLVRERGITFDRLAPLIEDGLAARSRSVERFCGLGRELDGALFNEGMWRSTLSYLSLREIQHHLEGYEVRFDQKYPPLPLSQPEPLDKEETTADTELALSILNQ